MNPPRNCLAILALACAASACQSATEPVPYPVTLRGHQDVRLETTSGETDRVVPVFVRPGSSVVLCLAVPPTTDTSSWAVELEIDSRHLDRAPEPTTRLATTVCFKSLLPEDLPIPADLELCGTLDMGVGGRSRRLPCQSLRTAEGAAWESLQRRLDELLAGQAALSMEELATRLDALAAEAEAATLPLLAVRIELITVHFLSLTGHPTAARQRLEALPAWLDQSAAHGRAAQRDYLRAQIALLGERRADAWRALDDADQFHLRSANPERFTVAMQQAALLSDAGAGHQAVTLLGERLAECEVLRCDPGTLEAGRLQMARLVLSDPFRTRDDLQSARKSLGEIASNPESDTGIALWIIIAALDKELGEDPSPALARARGLLPTVRDGLRARYEVWIVWLEAQVALEKGDGDGALAACRPLVDRGERSINPWAWSCVARAHRLRGALAAADLAFAKTLAHHEASSATSLGLRLEAGLGPQADDVARAARVAIESGQPERAWELLARLDQRSAHEPRRARCRGAAQANGDDGRWRALEEEMESVLSDLTNLDLPASLAREAEARTLRRELQRQLQVLWRSWPGCEEIPVEIIDRASFRAFVVDDEVILLQRRAGRVETVRRRSFGRFYLARLADEIEDILARGSLDDESWRHLLAPAAGALLPEDLSALRPTEIYALHGMLQAIPLAALPLPEGAPGAWLADLTNVVLQPAGAQSSETEGDPLPGLFIVDPLGDLPQARQSIESYRSRFPKARVLERGAATRQALRDHLEEARWLHLDTHASYEVGFPELSRIQLSDGWLRLVELAQMPMPRLFANLSGCRTGAWHPTADSGRYGLGGLLARLGVPWVIATRSLLDDRLAKAYNLAFYEAMGDGASPAEAHRLALEEQRARFPAAVWASLLLLHAPPEVERVASRADANKNAPGLLLNY